MLAITIDIPNLNQTAGNIDWSANSKDLLLVLILALSVLIHIFILKRDKIFAWLFGIYTSYLIVLFFPYNQWLSKLNLEQIVWLKSGGLIILSIFLAVIFSRGHIFAGSQSGVIARFIHATFYGVLSASLLLSLLAILLPVELLSQFSSLAQNIFNSDTARFVWLALPLVLILFSIKFNRHKGPGRPPLE